MPERASLMDTIRHWREPTSFLAPRTDVALILVLLWVGAGLVFNLNWVGLYNGLWFGVLLVAAVHALCGIVLIIANLGPALSGRRDRWVPLLLAVATFAAFTLCWRDVTQVGNRIGFEFRRSAIEQIIQLELARPEPINQYLASRKGVEFHTSAGMPDAVAFPLVKGIPDGGNAIVHDPLDRLIGLTAENWESKAPGLDQLLVGRPTFCRSFAKPHYFYCSFS